MSPGGKAILYQSRRGGDHGGIPFPLALGLGLGITIVVVVPLTIWALTRSSGPKLTIPSVQAARGSDNNVTIAVNYLVHYPSTAYAATLTSNPTITCTVVQSQLSGPRTFTGTTDVAGSTQDVSGTLTISVPPSQHSIQGAFSVSCHVDRSGSQLASANGPGVNVPAPTFTSPTGSTGSGKGTSGSSGNSGGSNHNTGPSGSSGNTGSGTGPSGAGPTGVTGNGSAYGFACPNLGGTTLFAGGKIDKTSNGGFDYVCNYAKNGYDAGQVVAYWFGAGGATGQSCPLATAGERDDGTQTSGTYISSSKLAYVTYYFYDPGNQGAVPKAPVIGLAHKLLAAANSLASVC